MVQFRKSGRGIGSIKISTIAMMIIDKYEK